MAPLLARRPTKMTLSPLSGNVAPGGVAGQTALAPHHDDPTDWSSTSKTKSMCDVSFTRTSRDERRWSCRRRTCHDALASRRPRKGFS